MNLVLEVTHQIHKARSKLIIRDPFYGSLVSTLEMYPLKLRAAQQLAISTIGTDGKRLYYVPKNIKNISVPKLVTMCAHEGAHVGHKHHLRRGDREPVMWNWACDYAINWHLKQAGYDLFDGLYNKNYGGMSAERIYKILWNDREAKRAKLRQMKEQSIVLTPEYSGDYEEGDDESCIDDTLGEACPLDEDWDLDGTEPTSDETDKLDSQTLEQEWEEDPDDEGANGIPDDLLMGDIAKEGEEDQELDLGVDGAGVVLDAPNDAEEDKLDMQMTSAYLAAKAAGKLHAHVEDLIQAEFEHQQDYRDALREFLDEVLECSDYSWSKPNKRYQGDFFLPSIVNDENQPRIGLFVDTSGSISDEEKKVYAQEISGVLEEFECKLTVVYGDTGIRGTQEISTEDLPIDFEMLGGGGTYFMPVFRFFRDEFDEDIEALLFFTDMGAFDWGRVKDFKKHLDYEVLWMSTEQQRDDGRYSHGTDNVPFGQVIHLDLDKEE